MRLLVLGGTRFVGPALIDAARSRGWEVTAAARGASGEVRAGIDFARVDRETDRHLEALGDREFDVVVDTWSGAPRIVAASARALRDRTGSYVYVSSRSVYADPIPRHAREDAPLVAAAPDAEATSYPADKRGAEIAVAEQFPAGLLLRAGLVLGPRENVGRLPWWLRRIARAGEVLAPGPPDLALQYVDARDLAAFALDAASAGRSGPYNVVSKPGHTTMGALLDACREVTGSGARLRWVMPDAILEAGIAPWTELPIWLPPDSPDYALHLADTSRAYEHGLRCRSMTETVADTWEWLLAAGEDAGRGAPGRPIGLDPETERRLLAAVSRPSLS